MPGIQWSLPVTLVAISVGLVNWQGPPLLAQTKLSAPRALVLPVLRAGTVCPVSHGSRDVVQRAGHIFGSGGVWFGDGPVYVNFAWKGDTQPPARFSVAPIPAVDGARRAKTPWVTEPTFAGSVVVRGRSLHANAGTLRFSSGTGVVGEVLSMQAPFDRPSSADWSFQATSIYIPGPGCYGLQIDTPHQTSVVVFEATP
jgi:hypothetical protein